MLDTKFTGSGPKCNVMYDFPEGESSMRPMQCKAQLADGCETLHLVATSSCKTLRVAEGKLGILNNLYRIVSLQRSLYTHAAEMSGVSRLLGRDVQHRRVGFPRACLTISCGMYDA